jgi:hypothetical protein
MVLRERTGLRGRSTGKGAKDGTSYVNCEARLVRGTPDGTPHSQKTSP